ncbi:MAG: DNA polymerase IV [Bacteroidota bacterium]
MHTRRVSTSLSDGRTIANLDIDTFFAAVEIRDNNHLRERPLIVGGSHARGIVSSCSYEAKRFGIHVGMPIKVAMKRCPEATILQGDMDKYKQASVLITEIISEEAPVFEKAAIDEFYLDLSGMDRFMSSWQWSLELQERIQRESGLNISLGMAANKLVSKVGVNLKQPKAQVCIDTGYERGFLAPLPLRKLPGIGSKTQHKLITMGIKKVGLLAQIPPALLLREFGKTGQKLWQKANGIDRSPVIPYRSAKSISRTHNFQIDTIDTSQLRAVITHLTSLLGFELRQSGKLASKLTVKLRYTDGNTYSRQARMAHTAVDNRLIPLAIEQFDLLFQRRQLVRMVGVKLDDLAEGLPQVDLFRDTGKEIALLQAMDKIRSRFGEEAVRLANIG